MHQLDLNLFYEFTRLGCLKQNQLQDRNKTTVLVFYSCSHAAATPHPFPASTWPGSHHLINILLKLRTMHNCPIIPSITWFSRASQSISSHIWNCSAPDGRGHDSNKPMKDSCQYNASCRCRNHLLVTRILTTWARWCSRRCIACASSDASA